MKNYDRPLFKLYRMTSKTVGCGIDKITLTDIDFRLNQLNYQEILNLLNEMNKRHTFIYNKNLKVSENLLVVLTRCFHATKYTTIINQTNENIYDFVKSVTWEK